MAEDGSAIRLNPPNPLVKGRANTDPRAIIAAGTRTEPMSDSVLVTRTGPVASYAGPASTATFISGADAQVD